MSTSFAHTYRPLLVWAADPATWMLDISTVSAEERLEQDLADAYASSHLHECAARLPDVWHSFGGSQQSES